MTVLPAENWGQFEVVFSGALVSSGNPFPVILAGASPPPIVAVVGANRGGVISTGGSSQPLAAANASRKALFVENPPDAASQGIPAAENLTINVNNATAVINGVAGNYAVLAPGQSCTVLVGPGLIDRSAVNINGATTGHIYNAMEYQ